MKSATWLLLTVGALLVTVFALACGGSNPTPTPPPTPVVATKMETNIGTPPPEGWKWVIAERSTGADEVKETASAHGFFWIFFVISGSTEVSTADGTKVASANEGIMVPANQQHSHRFLPQSKVLAFDVRSANDNPDRFHGGTKLLVSDKIDVKASPESKMRIRTLTFSPGSRTSQSLSSDPNFGYVADGTLTLSEGGNVSRVEAGKTFVLPLSGNTVVSNEGGTPLRVILADVRP